MKIVELEPASAGSPHRAEAFVRRPWVHATPRHAGRVPIDGVVVRQRRMPARVPVTRVHGHEGGHAPHVIGEWRRACPAALLRVRLDEAHLGTGVGTRSDRVPTRCGVEH